MFGQHGRVAIARRRCRVHEGGRVLQSMNMPRLLPNLGNREAKSIEFHREDRFKWRVTPHPDGVSEELASMNSQPEWRHVAAAYPSFSVSA